MAFQHQRTECFAVTMRQRLARRAHTVILMHNMARPAKCCFIRKVAKVVRRHITERADPKRLTGRTAFRDPRVVLTF